MPAPGAGSRSAAAAWPIAALGVGMLTFAQRSSAAVGFGDFFGTYAGGAIQGRCLSLVVAGGALLAARAARSATAARAALGVAAGAAAAMIAVHVAAGHAATSSDSGRWVTIAAQWTHAAAIGVWIGGLAALLLGTRGAPSSDKAAAVRRFSRIAAVALAIVVVTGVARGFVAIRSWDELVSSGYGQLILVKVALVGFIALLALRNRLRSVPAAATTLRPLRRVSAGELSSQEWQSPRRPRWAAFLLPSPSIHSVSPSKAPTRPARCRRASSPTGPCPGRTVSTCASTTGRSGTAFDARRVTPSVRTARRPG